MEHGTPIDRELLVLRFTRSLPALAVLVGVVASCSSLPQSGPDRSAMMAAANDQHKVAVVEVNTAVVSVLSASQPPSLVGTFGDNQPPRTQRIGIGDSVQITLWEAAQGGLFSSPAVDRFSPGARTAIIPDQVVAQDGAITVPFAGRVPVVGRTPPQVEQIIVDRLADKAINPQALVTVTHNVSNTVTVMGEVGPGAQVQLSVRGDRLLTAIAEAGGVREPVVDTSVVLQRGDRIVRVPMEAVLEDPRENIYLQPSDVVTLVHDPQTFTAAGATGRNAVVPFNMERLTLDEALGMAGGLLDERADPAGLFVVRFETPQVAAELPQAHGVAEEAGRIPVIYHLNMRDPDSLFLARSFPIRNKDIVYVSNAPFTDVQKVFNLINLLVTPAVTGITVQNATR